MWTWLDGLFISALHYEHKPVYRAKMQIPWEALKSNCPWKCQLGLPKHAGTFWQHTLIRVSLTWLSPVRSWDLNILKVFFHSQKFLWVFSLGHILTSWIHFRKWSIWKTLWLAEKSCTLGTRRSGLNSQLCIWLTLCPWASHLASLSVYFLPGKMRRIMHKDAHLTKMCQSYIL